MSGVRVSWWSRDRIALVLRRHREVVTGVEIAALGRARWRIRGIGTLVPSGQQRREVESAGGASLLGATEGRRGGRKIAALFEQRAEFCCAGGMAVFVCARECVFAFGQATLPLKQHRQLERAVGDAAFGGVAICVLGADEIMSLLEQHAEVVRGRIVPALVGATISRLGAADVAPVLEQYSKVVGRGLMTAFVSAPERVLGFRQHSMAGQQYPELERTVRVAALVGTSESGTGAGDVATLLEQHTEVVGGAGVPALIRARESLFGCSQLVLPCQQHRDLERTARVPPFVPTAIRRRGTGQVTARFEQHPELGRSGGVPALVCAGEPFLSLGEPVLASEVHRALERAVGVGALLGPTVRNQGTGQEDSPIMLVFTNDTVANPFAPIEGLDAAVCRFLVRRACRLYRRSAFRAATAVAEPRAVPLARTLLFTREVPVESKIPLGRSVQKRRTRTKVQSSGRRSRPSTEGFVTASSHHVPQAQQAGLGSKIWEFSVWSELRTSPA